MYPNSIKSLSKHVQFHVQHSFRKWVTTVQSDCIIFFQECFEIPAFCKNTCVHIYKKPLVYMYFSAAVLFKWNIIFPLNIFFQTHHHWPHLKLDKTLPHWMTAIIHKWIHPSPITLCHRLVSYFHFCHLYFNQETKPWSCG